MGGVALIQRRLTSAETKCCLISVTPLRRQEGLCAALNTQASALLRFIQRRSCEERWRFVLGANGFDGKSEMRVGGEARKPRVQTGFEKQPFRRSQRLFLFFKGPLKSCNCGALTFVFYKSGFGPSNDVNLVLSRDAVVPSRSKPAARCCGFRQVVDQQHNDHVQQTCD